MATRKKIVKKTTKKSPSRTKKRATKAKSLALSSEDRSRLLKPRTGAEELALRIVESWEDRNDLRVPGLTRAGLAALARKAERAAQKEQALADAQARKLRPLSDSRALADDALWRAVLDFHSEVKHRSKRDASLNEAFSFVGDAFKNQRASNRERDAEDNDVS